MSQEVNFHMNLASGYELTVDILKFIFVYTYHTIQYNPAAKTTILQISISGNLYLLS